MSIELAKKCGAVQQVSCDEKLTGWIWFYKDQLAAYEAAIREDERKCSEPVAWKCTVDGVHWAFSEKKKCRYCLPVYESPVAWMREDSCMVIPDKAKQLLLKAKKKEAELYKIPLYLSPQPDREKELLAEIERLNNEIRTQCDNCSLIDGG